MEEIKKVKVRKKPLPGSVSAVITGRESAV